MVSKAQKGRLHKKQNHEAKKLRLVVASNTVPETDGEEASAQDRKLDSFKKLNKD